MRDEINLNDKRPVNFTGGDAWAFQSCSPSSKQEIREAIAGHVEEYLASGKKIKIVPILIREGDQIGKYAIHRSPGPGRPKKKANQN